MQSLIMAETPFFSISLDTIIPTLLNTLILFLVIRHFLFKPVNKVIDSRKQEVDDIYSKADIAKTSADAMKDEYEKKLSGAKDESARILETASKRANEQSSEIIADAKSQAKAIIERAGDEIETEKRRAVNEIKTEITGMVFDVAERVVDRNITTDDNEKMINEFIDNMEKL